MRSRSAATWATGRPAATRSRALRRNSAGYLFGAGLVILSIQRTVIIQEADSEEVRAHQFATVLRSDDGGQHWQRTARMTLSDLDVDPDDPMRVVGATRDGLTESLDRGAVFAAFAPQPPRPLILIDHIAHTGGDREPVLVGVDAAGAVWSLGSQGWRASGQAPGPPNAFTVIAPGRYVFATDTQVFVSEDAGRSWMLRAGSAGP